MTIRTHDYLPADFQRRLAVADAACARRGVQMVTYCSRRHPVEQGGLWRRSRSRAVVEEKIASLREQGADFLADCIVKAGPQNGPWATNAIPGYSLHMWDLAVDRYWLVGKQAIWSARTKVNGINGYQVHREECQRAGLHIAVAKDWPHIQAVSNADAPYKRLTPAQVDAEMRRRFGG